MEDQNILDTVIDFRFLAIEMEVDAVETQRSAIESQLPAIQEAEEEKIRQESLETYGLDEGEERFFSETWIDLFLTHELPRLFRYPVLVSLWAVYESATRDVAKELQKHRGELLELDDLKGDVLARTKKYFDHVLRFPLTVDSKELSYLRMLVILRNVIAHANGRKEAISRKVWRSIEAFKTPGIDTDFEYIGFSKEFIEHMVQVVTGALSGLIQRAKVSLINLPKLSFSKLPSNPFPLRRLGWHT